MFSGSSKRKSMTVIAEEDDESVSNGKGPGSSHEEGGSDVEDARFGMSDQKNPRASTPSPARVSYAAKYKWGT